MRSGVTGGTAPMVSSHDALPHALSGAALFADVQHYERLGVHRYGSPGAEQAFDWIATELARAGFVVENQPFTMARQYELRSARLSLNGRQLAVLPQWWLPDACERMDRTARIVSSASPHDSAEGAFVRLSVPFGQGAYLQPAHRQAFAAAFARQPAAVLLTIDHPSGEAFSYNVSQTDEPWPAPLILVAPKHAAWLDEAQAAGQPVRPEIDGNHRRDVAGRNVIGRLDRGRGRAIVVSTPVTGWDVNTCERGPGIAAFLAMARMAVERFQGVDLVFAATSGHEIGHGGMAHFIESAAPKPAAVAAWAHFGASLACYRWQRDGDHWVVDPRADGQARLVNRTDSLATLVDRHFGAIEARRLGGEAAAIGELREVFAAGYANFFGMAGGHTFFHTQADTSAGTGPEILEPVARAFADALSELAAAALP